MIWRFYRWHSMIITTYYYRYHSIFSEANKGNFSECLATRFAGKQRSPATLQLLPQQNPERSQLRCLFQIFDTGASRSLEGDGQTIVSLSAGSDSKPRLPFFNPWLLWSTYTQTHQYTVMIPACNDHSQYCSFMIDITGIDSFTLNLQNARWYIWLWISLSWIGQLYCC